MLQHTKARVLHFLNGFSYLQSFRRFLKPRKSDLEIFDKNLPKTIYRNFPSQICR